MPGRVEIDNVQPVVSCGAYPAKAVVGEVVPVSAAVWREGHEAVAATLVVRYLGPRYPKSTETRRIKAVQAPEKRDAPKLDAEPLTTGQAAADADDDGPGALRLPRPVHPRQCRIVELPGRRLG